MNKSDFYLKIMEIATNLVRADIEHNKFIHEATSYEDEQITIKKLFDMYVQEVEKKFFQLMNKDKSS
ncbi:MAG: hypothetical protein BWK78_07375 [Thiotrichaceae bacterium IS1]|nr:MAG: hypothetical protein BWK78_07375 [Thiotrichaceae bacterium IS1]